MGLLGVVGGIAPGSTVDYYRLLIAEYQARTSATQYPAIVINSIDLTRLLRLAGENRVDELASWLVDEVRRLARAGATVGLMASNTPHMVFDAVARESPIPLLSIVEAAGDACAAQGLRSVGLLGTRFTMAGTFYQVGFAKRGIAVLAPAADDLAFVHDRYVRELIVGDFRAETRTAVLAVIRRLADAGAEGVLLAGTELPLLLRGSEVPGVPLLDTTALHVQQAVTALLAG